MSELNLNYNTTLQSNNTDLQAILNTINELPEVNEWSENEDAIIAGEIKSYINDRVTNIKNGAFQYCHSLTTVSFPKCERIYHNAFFGCRRLKSLYLMNSKMCTLSNSTAFDITPIGGYSDWISTYGSIYVPTSLLTSYQTATNWAYFSSRFVGI